MTELDLGGLFATADVIDAPFNAKFTGLVRKYATLAKAAERWAAASATADRALADNAAAADKFAASLNRTTQSTTRAAAAEEKAAAAASRHSEAVTRVGVVMSTVTTDAQRLQQAELRLIAAQERYNAVLESGTASTAQLASAQAALIGAERALFRTQEQVAGRTSTLTGSVDRQTAATERLAAAQRTQVASSGASVVATGRLGSGMLRTAGELGLVIGVIEGVKKAIDIGKAASSFQREMLLIQTQARGIASEVTDLSARVLAMAGPVATAPDELATSLYHVYSVGRDANGELIRGARAMNIVRIAAQGAKIGIGDVEDTTNALTSTVASGISGVTSFGQAMGVLNTIVGVGDMHFQDLNNALGTGILARMRVFGVSIQETGAALAVFGDNNIRGRDAATQLRMAVQDLAKPAATADKVLARINLTAQDLRTELSEHGLAGALHLLDERMTAAGITGNKVGGFLEDAFTKKAGAGLAIMLTQMDRFDSKLDEINKGGDSFSAQWRATTQTASFQFQRLGTEAEVAGIKIANKVIPAATAAATWLGTNLPHAISTLAHILGPTVDLVGHGLVMAWHAVAAVLSVVVGVLSSVGHFLAANRTAVTGVTTVVLAMWAAFKLAALVTAGLRLIGPLLTAIGTRAFSAGQAILSGFTGGNVAVAAFAAAIGVLVMTWQKHQQEVAANTAAIQAYSQALDADSGAIARHVQAQAEQNLVNSNGYALATSLGVSQGDLTDAVLAQGGAYTRLRDQILATAKANGANNIALDVLGRILDQNHQQLGTAIQDRKDVIAAQKEETAKHWAAKSAMDASRVAAGRNADALGNLAAGSHDVATATKSVSMGMDGDSVSAKRLADYIQRLTTNYQKLVNAELAQTQSQLAFKQGLLQLRQQVKDYGTSLSDATLKGVQNRQGLVSLLQTSEQAAEGSKNYGATLLANVKNFIQFATHAGYSKGALMDLLRQEHMMPSQIRQSLHLVNYELAHSQLGTLQQQINNLPSTINIGVHYGITGGKTLQDPPTRARGGSLPEGVSVVGEGNGGAGTELAVKHGSNVQIVPHGPAMRYLRAVGARIPGFAGGTDHAQTAVTKASAALTSVSLDKSGFSWTRFASQIATAAQAVKDAIAAGATKAQIASLQARLARDRTEGHALERALGRSVLHGFAGLGHLIGEVQTTGAHGKMLGQLSSRSDVRGALGDLEGQLRQAGLPKAFIKSLGDENKAILATVASRNIAARHLAAANAALGKAQDKLHGDDRSFAGAISGSFDITQAGADANGRVTRGGIVAADNQAVTRARAFVAGMKKLIGLKVFPNRYLRSLLGQGPAALAEVQALAGMPRAELQQLADDNRQLNKLGKQLGGLGAGRLDQGAVDAAQKRVDKYQRIENRREKHLHTELAHLADRIESKLDHLNLLAKLDFNKGQLALAVRDGQVENSHRTRSTPPRPGSR